MTDYRIFYCQFCFQENGFKTDNKGVQILPCPNVHCNAQYNFIDDKITTGWTHTTKYRVSYFYSEDSCFISRNDLSYVYINDILNKYDYDQYIDPITIYDGEIKYIDPITQDNLDEVAERLKRLTVFK